tara:strand:- start:500 stop:715 length:216 start_codon:yes stop_codon:yes gene_type:complete
MINLAAFDRDDETQESENKLSQKQLKFIADNRTMFFDKNSKSILTKEAKREFNNFMFGEDFMNSNNKGELI